LLQLPPKDRFRSREIPVLINLFIMGTTFSKFRSMEPLPYIYRFRGKQIIHNTLFPELFSDGYIRYDAILRPLNQMRYAPPAAG
jgi:hypothetical protein